MSETRCRKSIKISDISKLLRKKGDIYTYNIDNLTYVVFSFPVQFVPTILSLFYTNCRTIDVAFWLSSSLCHRSDGNSRGSDRNGLSRHRERSICCSTSNDF